MSARRAGAYWRLLVHGVPAKGHRMSGAAHSVYSDARDVAKHHEVRARLGEYPTKTEETVTHLPDTEFDELVVGHWLHIEEMNYGTWWMNVGGVVLHVHADRDGRPRHVTVHPAGTYNDKVPGCEYEVAGEPS